MIDNPGIIYRPNLLLIEETDINNYLLKQSSIDSVLEEDTTINSSLVRDSKLDSKLSVDDDLGVVVNRLIGTEESFNTEIDVASLVVRGVSQTTKAEVSSDVATNPGRNCYVIPFISVETDVNGKLSAIYSPAIQLQVEDSLTVLVGVVGAVIPLQQINFQLTMNTVLNFTVY